MLPAGIRSLAHRCRRWRGLPGGLTSSATVVVLRRTRDDLSLRRR